MLTGFQIEKIVSRIAEVSDPETIILFGSYASGNADDKSDLDFLLIKKTGEPPVNRTAYIRKSLRDILFPLDILVYTPEEVEKDKNNKFSFIYEVITNGKVVYGRL